MERKIKKHQFEAVVFDMDGLLLDSERIALNTFRETCEFFRLGDQTDLFLRCIGLNAIQGEHLLKTELEGRISHREFGDYWDRRYEEETNKRPVPLKQGAVELLNHLTSINVPRGIATSTDSQRARKKLADSGILQHFDIIVGGEMVSASKPEPDIYLKATELLQTSPSRCLAVEDSENGVRSAVSAGLYVIQIPDLAQPSDDLLKLGHTVLKNLGDVVEHSF